MAESTGDPAVAGSETHGKPVASPETTEIIEAEASEAPELRRHGGHRPSPFPHNSVPQLLKGPGRCACAAPIADSRIGRQCGCDRALLRHAPSRIPGFAKHGRIRQARTWADAASRPARSAASAPCPLHVGNRRCSSERTQPRFGCVGKLQLPGHLAWRLTTRARAGRCTNSGLSAPGISAEGETEDSEAGDGKSSA